MKRTIIGIDPDVDRSGVCVMRDLKLSFTGALDFTALTDLLREQDTAETVIIVEAGYLVKKSNWHGAINSRAATRIAENTGRNHQVARMITDMAKRLGFEVIEQKPYKKIWKGREGKITHGEITAFVPGFPPRSGQDVRDSVLLVWYYANLPIRIKP